MINASRQHLAAAGETYGEHLRFAATVGLMAIGAGLACLIHALVPAACQRTCSTTVALLNELFADRSRLASVAERASGAMTFSGLLALAATTGLLPYLAGVPAAIGAIILALALAFPIAFLAQNSELGPVWGQAAARASS